MQLPKKIQEYLFRRALRQHPRRDARFPNYEKIRSVLLVYQSDLLERNDDIKALRDILLQDGKEVTMVGYVEKKQAESLILPMSRILAWTDIAYTGCPNDAVLRDLRQNHYDLMIDLSTERMLPLLYVTLHADADFKAGLHHIDGICHFMIEKAEAGISATELFQYIHHYLKSIGTQTKVQNHEH